MALFDLKKSVKEVSIALETPEWALPFLNEDGTVRASEYKFIKGGRGSGKSFFVVEMCIDKHITDPDFKTVCIREIQKSTKYSVKKLVEDTIKRLGVSHLFDIQETTIKRIGGDGIIIFMGMQDHTADSIKSLEGFDLALVEEAQSLSMRSIQLLIPTLRKNTSEIWFAWNPYIATDAIEITLASLIDTDRCIFVHANYLDNPFISQKLLNDAATSKENDPDNYPNIWLGELLTRTDDQVFGGKFSYADLDEEVENSDEWTGPYHGMDFGFAADPSTVVKVWRKGEEAIYIQREAGGQHIENTDLAKFVCTEMEGIDNHVIRADCSQPALISQLKKRPDHFVEGRREKPEDFYLTNIVGCEKWPGSLLEGIKHMQSYKNIYIHPSCDGVAEEMRMYKYKTDKGTGEILPKEPIDKWNHYIDGIRYALGPFIKNDGVFTDYGSLF